MRRRGHRACPTASITITFSGGPDYVTGRRDRGRRPTARRSVASAAALDRSSGARLVFRRPSRPCGRLLALPGPDAGRRARRHHSPDRGESLNIGSMLTWGPCYYHQRQFFSGKDDTRIHAIAEAALRRRGLGVPVEPCRPPRAARAEGAGLPGHEAHRGLAHVDDAGAAMGEAAGRRHRLCAFGLGTADRGARICRRRSA